MVTGPHGENPPFLPHHLKLKLNLCFVGEVRWSMPQGLTLSGLSVDSQSPLLCPMSSTSSTRDRNRIWLSGDVLGGRVPTFWCIPLFPLRSWAWIPGGSRALPYHMVGARCWLSPSQAESIMMCSVSHCSDLSPTHDPGTELVLTEIAIWWLGWGDRLP